MYRARKAVFTLTACSLLNFEGFNLEGRLKMLDSEVRIVIQERIAPIARHYVKGFDVFNWLENNKDVAEELTAQKSAADVVATIRHKLEPYLLRLSQSQLWC